MINFLLDNVKSFGVGEWNGHTLNWYLKEWDIHKTHGHKNIFITYLFDPQAQRFKPGIIYIEKN